MIANVQMERLAAPAGPTGGKILRPSDGKPPTRVAFVQCAGSRDANHLPYCSAVCCLASLKQALYVHEQLPDTEITIFYIDRRTPGRNEDMLTRVAELKGVHFVKGKVGERRRRAPTDASSSRSRTSSSAGSSRRRSTSSSWRPAWCPTSRATRRRSACIRDEDGFGLESVGGLVVAGVARRPEDVAATTRDATGAAAKACMVTGRSA